MRQVAGGYAPEVPLRDVPWGGNGFYSADNDVFGATIALEQAVKLWIAGGAPLAATLDNGRRTAAAYGPETRREAVDALWKRLGNG